MSKRSHLTELERWKENSGLEGNQIQAELAETNGVSRSEISMIWKLFGRTRNAVQRAYVHLEGICHKEQSCVRVRKCQIWQWRREGLCWHLN
ncbi:hypothetical protein TNCT_341761 [Trichonephila clavata]|uniref:Uncharacterized protein n=1 Tax=Trichonephila clavata TaxID=2740835 RepID=A0A8X6GJD3_TRICU|nr:hypothetical protein TNCT_341761 [Trichonephila clavata]